MKKMRLPAILLFCILAAAQAIPAQARVVDGVVAVVDDDPITFSEVRDAAAEGLGIPVGDADLYLREEKDTRRILHWIETLVESVLLHKELKKLGQDIQEPDINRAVESVRRNNNLSEADFKEALVREGISLEGYRRRLRWQMERGAIVRAKKLKDVTVTDEEVKIYYKENAERFREGGEVRLMTLYLPLPPEDAGPDRVVRLRIAAQQANEYVRAGRALSDVSELISKTLPGTSVLTSNFVKTSDLLPEIQKEIRRLRTFETSPTFFMENGAYLVHVKERQGGTLPEFSNLKDALAEEIADRRSEKAYADILAELKKTASIDIRL
ncbi:MAG: peptidyl-prolyl cis-trans isomerase [Deltaproteobacteria bacterium]|nr:peptidyl-prolyl cis-trans isomerase [Deltaproteobacteria bacterium]